MKKINNIELFLVNQLYIYLLTKHYFYLLIITNIIIISFGYDYYETRVKEVELINNISDINGN